MNLDQAEVLYTLIGRFIKLSYLMDDIDFDIKYYSSKLVPLPIKAQSIQGKLSRLSELINRRNEIEDDINKLYKEEK